MNVQTFGCQSPIDEHCFVDVKRRWPAEAYDSTPDYSVNVAQSRDDMNLIGRLRYRLFIARDGKPYDHIDHMSRTFIEPVDRCSLNFWVRNGNECTAAVRLTRAADAIRFPHLAQVIECSNVSPGDLSTTLLSSRMVVQESLRARMRISQLLRHAYRVGILCDARRCLIGLRPSLSPLYSRFGFRELPVTFVDSVAGEMVVMAFDLYDRAHMVRVNSPFLKVFDATVGANSQTCSNKEFA